MNYFAIDKTAVIWWEKKAEYADEYVVCVNGAEVCRTKCTHCRIAVVGYEKCYEVEIFVCGVLYDRHEILSDKKREFINVTKAPYFAEGSGKVMNTSILQTRYGNLARQRLCAYECTRNIRK